MAPTDTPTVRAADKPHGPMTVPFWARQIDPFDEMDEGSRLAAACRCRSAYATHLGRRGGYATAAKRPTTTP